MSIVASNSGSIHCLHNAPRHHSGTLIPYSLRAQNCQQITEMTYGSLSCFFWSSSIQLLTIAGSDYLLRSWTEVLGIVPWVNSYQSMAGRHKRGVCVSGFPPSLKREKSSRHIMSKDSTLHMRPFTCFPWQGELGCILEPME